MRILYIDIDTLRADHLGCYGYLRDTTPNIDRIADEGVRFENCYVSDAPCLPSRGSMFTGMFGIHSGIVGHGGTAADLRPIGRERNFSTRVQRPGLIEVLAGQGIYPVSISPFAARHSAWWFCAGWREMVNTGKNGGEIADEVAPQAIKWIEQNAKKDNWLLHVNLWDPHTHYRTPDEFGNPFEDEPIDDWYTEELRERQWESFGPGSPREPGGNYGRFQGSARQPAQIASMADYRKQIDGYDCGIRYADQWCGRIFNALGDQGVLNETIVIVTSDHGENQGELAVIGDHATADHITSRVPMILRYPSLPGGRVDDGLYNQNDIAATLVELVSAEVPSHWDGISFVEQFRNGRSAGRDHVVFSQCCWSCQRSVRWDDYVYIHTYHTGLKNFPQRMLFNVSDDPHELVDLADTHTELADRGEDLIEQWTAEMMSTSAYDEDPLWTVISEGGPYHTRHPQRIAEYLQRLRDTNRSHHADFLQTHPTGLV